MSRIVIAISLFLSIVLSAFTCNKRGDYVGDNIYTAVVKSTYSCARYYACVITEGNIDADLVDNNWQHEGQTYQKAFAVGNYCDFPTNLKEGTSFKFRIIKKAKSNDCSICMIGINGEPSKNLNIIIQ